MSMSPFELVAYLSKSNPAVDVWELRTPADAWVGEVRLYALSRRVALLCQSMDAHLFELDQVKGYTEWTEWLRRHRSK